MELQITPIVSEKSYAQAQVGTYAFTVPTIANKKQIADAVAKQFDVTVTGVTTAITKGKVKRAYRKKGTSVTGTRKDVKKAYVRLTEGQTIAAFAAVEAEGEKK
jgi:large subunit ribosomal protein L23